MRSAIEAGPDHISAYALIVEDGTRLAARIRRGELAPPDDDELADRYLAADAAFGAAGLELVRGVELGGGLGVGLRGLGLPAQPAVLDRRQLVGRRAGRAQPRRRHPLVERPPSFRLRGRIDGRGEPGPGPGGTDRCRTADRADHADDAAGVWLRPRRAQRRWPAGRRDARWRTAWPREAHARPGAWC